MLSSLRCVDFALRADLMTPLSLCAACAAAVWIQMSMQNSLYDIRNTSLHKL